MVENADTEKLILVAISCDEYVYTEARLNLRELPNVNSDVVCTLPENARIHRVGTTGVGWSIIQIDGINYFMWDEYLTETEPEYYADVTTIEEYLPKKEQVITQEKQQPQEIIESTQEQTSSESAMSYLGEWTVTFYTETGNNTASGVYPTVGHTVACNNLPFGTVIYVDGLGAYSGYYVVEDRGVPSDNWIDIYVGVPSAIPSYGMTTTSVYVVG